MLALRVANALRLICGIFAPARAVGESYNIDWCPRLDAAHDECRTMRRCKYPFVRLNRSTRDFVAELGCKRGMQECFWFIDKQNARVTCNELDNHLPGRTIEVIEGDFNVTVADLLASGRITESTATFCLLDQRTFECQWRTVERLAKHKSGRKIELFYFLGTGWLDRSLKATKDEDRLRRWWGGDDWRMLLSIRSWDRATIFCDRLKTELGYLYASPWPIYSKESGGRVMYYMIHATDHEAAPLLMNRAYLKANSRRETEKLLQHSLEELGLELPEQRRPSRTS
jgi:three-Cys-motif partner protein